MFVPPSMPRRCSSESEGAQDGLGRWVTWRRLGGWGEAGPRRGVTSGSKDEHHRSSYPNEAPGIHGELPGIYGLLGFSGFAKAQQTQTTRPRVGQLGQLSSMLPPKCPSPITYTYVMLIRFGGRLTGLPKIAGDERTKDSRKCPPPHNKTRGLRGCSGWTFICVRWRGRPTAGKQPNRRHQTYHVHGQPTRV